MLSQIDMEQRLASLNDNEITKMKQIDRELYDAVDNATIEVHKQLITNAQLIGKSTNIPWRIRQKVWHVIHNNYNIVKCIECNNGVAWNQMENRYRDFCSSKCSHNNEVVKQRLGAKEFQTKEHKVRRINEKHGTDFKTIAEAYQSGLYDHTYEGRKGRSRSQVEFTKEEQMAINEKRRMTNLERYGVDHHMQDKEIQSAVHAKGMATKRLNWTNREYDVRTPELLKEMNESMNLREIADHFEYNEHYISQLFTRFNITPIKHAHSAVEESIATLITNLGMKVIRHCTSTTSNGREIDILIPDKNIGIEVNGVRWHCDKFGKTSAYHLMKTTDLEAKGIELLHFWDFEIRQKFDIVQSMIKNKLGVSTSRRFARKCRVEKVSPSDAALFFNANHLQGHVKSSVYLGLYDGEELLQCASFSKTRFDKTVEWELIRLATKCDFNVVGGTGKLLKHFEREYNPKSLLSYADRRYSQGGVYATLGFEKLRETKPNVWYFKLSDARKLINRVQLQKHKLKDIIPNFSTDLTAWEMLKSVGYDRLWDCGSHVFIKRYD